MLYENELCHGCELVLSQDDDVVVCPVCGTPQHRACWQVHNACVSEALHTEGYLWKNDHAKSTESFDPSNELGIICPKCGTNNPAGTEDCEVCKNDQNSAEPAKSSKEIVNIPLQGKDLPFLAGISPEEVIDGIKAYDIALYTQLSAKRYINKFRQMDFQRKKISWNWAAFIFSPYWFFYRKLYWLGGIFLGLTIAMAIFFTGPILEFSNEYAKLLPILTKSNFSQSDMIYAAGRLAKYTWVIYGFPLLTFLTHSTSALLANMAYKQKVSAEIKSIRRFAKNENVFRMLTIKRGGTSSFALLGSIIGYDLIIGLVNQIVKSL